MVQRFWINQEGVDMIDIHSHIVFGVDDGPSTIDDSVEMVYQAERAGIKVIIATPHFNENLFETGKVAENYCELLLRTVDYDVTIKLGYEVLLNPYIIDILDNDDFFTLDNSRFMLIEFPFSLIPINSHEIIYELQLKDVIPIIAHPERCTSFVRCFDDFMDFIEAGCMVQLDAASIMGVYGKKTRHFAKKLIMDNVVDFVASDAHRASNYTDWYVEAYKKVIRWTSRENADRLFTGNAQMIIKNEEITQQS